MKEQQDYGDLYAWLQWGRGLSTPEINMRIICTWDAIALQWGRGLSTPEMTRSGRIGPKT